MILSNVAMIRGDDLSNVDKPLTEVFATALYCMFITYTIPKKASVWLSAARGPLRHHVCQATWIGASQSKHCAVTITCSKKRDIHVHVALFQRT
jgi:hypothetical protein